MKKTVFVGMSVALALTACQKKDVAKQGMYQDLDTTAVVVEDSAPRAKAADLVLKPTPEQLAKAHRVGNKHCPTDGEKLGSMGKPIPVIYKGELVELCCAGCPEEFAKDPAKYLAIAKADAASN